VDATGAEASDTDFMTLTDYLVDFLLIGLVLLQVRGRRLTLHSFLLPLVLVGWAAVTYLKAVPTGGNDVVLIAGCAAAGATIGALCAAFTSVKWDGSSIPMAKAGAIAAVLWVVGVGTRLAFQLYATHGGGPAIERFSVAHHITGNAAWTAALVLMAISEVVARSGGLLLRAYLRPPTSRPPVPAAPGRAMIGAGERSN
jgi:hypothetical protein